MNSEEQIQALEDRVCDLENVINRLETAHENLAQRVRLVQCGRSEDAHLILIGSGVLALVSLMEAVAIAVLWWLR
ncbi:hypothetical protein [Methylobacterium sp. 1973]|uniref:hypothetical protein n=1 Tax=Methylobacterium sp. 1973 TaxID=3156421 RepID=UPI003398F6B9